MARMDVTEVGMRGVYQLLQSASARRERGSVANPRTPPALARLVARPPPARVLMPGKRGSAAVRRKVEVPGSCSKMRRAMLITQAPARRGARCCAFRQKDSV